MAWFGLSLGLAWLKARHGLPRLGLILVFAWLGFSWLKPWTAFLRLGFVGLNFGFTWLGLNLGLVWFG